MARTKGKGGKYSAQNAGGKEKLNRGEAKKENDIKLDRNPLPPKKKVVNREADHDVHAGLLNNALLAHFLGAAQLESVKKNLSGLLDCATSPTLRSKVSDALLITSTIEENLAGLYSKLSEAQETTAAAATAATAAAADTGATSATASTV